MKPIFYFTLALFLGACGTKKQQATTVIPKDTTPVVQKPTREDTLKALALDPNDERYLDNYSTVIRTKTDGTQEVITTVIPKKTPEELQKEEEELKELRKNYTPTPVYADDDHNYTPPPPTELRKKRALEYYASEKFQVDSLKFAESIKNGSWKENGWTEEQTDEYIRNCIKNMKLNYSKFGYR